jgi:hypothetical protein
MQVCLDYLVDGNILRRFEKLQTNAKLMVLEKCRSMITQIGTYKPIY